MAELKYPIQLTPAQWAKNKSVLAKSKPTGIGEALTKLSKAHDDLDLALFDTARLADAEAVAQVLDHYEKEAKKKFVKAFQEAKSVEDVATTAAAVLKKAALVPKSAVEAAAAVAQAASDYAVDLTSVRQTGISTLEKLLESLKKSEAKKQDDSEDDDENAPAHVIAEKVAKKVVVALRTVKANQGAPEKPAQRFVIAAGKTLCSVFVGSTAGSSQKQLLKKILATEPGTPKFYEGECVWEHNAYTFVGDDIPVGGFVKRLQKALQEATEQKLKVRVRRTSGETEDADDEESTIPPAPPLPPTTSTTTSTTTPPTTSTTPSPPTGIVDNAEAVVKQRLKLLMPRLQIMLTKPGPTGIATKNATDDLTLKVSTKDFAAAAEILDKLELLANKLGVSASTPTRAPTDPVVVQRRDHLLNTKVQPLLTEIKNLADAIVGTPTYKTSYLSQYNQLLAEKERLALLETPVTVKKSLPNLIRRCELLKTRLATAAADAALALPKVNNWGIQPVVTLENSIKAPAGSDGLRLAMAPTIKTLKAKGAQAQKFFDNGEFGKAVALATNIFHLVTGANTAVANYARDYPAYKIERDKAVLAITALKNHVQAPAITAEIASIESQLQQIDSVATATDGWTKATTAVALIAKQCALVTPLADKLQNQAGKLPALTLKFTQGGADPTTAAKLAAYAHKLLVEEGCSEDDAVQMARDVDEYVVGGLNERDALVSARVCKSLKDAHIEPAKAKAVGKALRAGGTATAEDAKAVGKGLARLSVEVLDNLIANGIPTECFRGGVTEVDPESIGVVPRGWESTGKTWDHVPGMFSPGQNKVLVGTMDTGDGGRKVTGKGDVAGLVGGLAISHGTDDLVGHEAGHAFDVSDGDVKNENAEFRAARLRDIAAGNLVKRAVPVPPVAVPPTPKPQPADTATGMFVTRDNYFVAQSEAGVDETHASSGSQGDLDSACSESFAESFAMHFAGDSRWPELEKFWQANPWGV